jgi:EKC/KEOPS complex subunit CGI121/TPRKB
VSKQHLLTALLATLLTSLPQAAGALPAPPPPKTRTHNLHSEVLCALSPNNNISDAIRRFGVGEGTRRLVVARYGDDAVPAADVYAMIGRVVQGRLESVGRLDEADVPWGRVDKVRSREEGDGERAHTRCTRSRR